MDFMAEKDYFCGTDRPSTIKSREIFILNHRDHLPLYKQYFERAKRETDKIWAFPDPNLPNIPCVEPSMLDVVNTYKYMCRYYHNVFEETTRIKKRISEHPSTLSYRTKRKRVSANNDRPEKRKRPDFFSCSNPCPAVRGRRSRACRVCGYAITSKDKSYINLSCCNKDVHLVCWETSSAKYLRKNKKSRRHTCDMISDYLERDGLSIRPFFSVPSSTENDKPVDKATAISASAPATTGTTATVSSDADTVVCKYCKKPYGITEKQHLQSGCSELDKFFDPGGGDLGAVGSITPLARRSAVSSRLDASLGTPHAKRVPSRK